MVRVRASMMVAALAAAYLVAFALLEPALGDAVLALAVLPIVLGAWIYGTRAGVLGSAAFIALNLALMQTVGGQHGFRPSQIPRIFVGLVLAAAAGRIGELSRKQKQLTAALRTSQRDLERAVAERTAELVQANEARREAEARAATADRMAVVGMLTAGIGHEINNPLSVIIANLDFIAEVVDPHDSNVAESIGDAQAAARRAADIVQHMRVFIQSNTTSSHSDVKRVVDSTIRMVANEIRHRARLELDIAETPHVPLSTAQLGQILLNLLVNAVHALPPGKNHTIRVTCGTAGGRVRISVSDTGHGIPPELQEHIFDPFFTTKPVGQGTGLGLWVCHQLVTAAGGVIGVESLPNSGTTFVVELPVATPTKTGEARPGPVLARTVKLLVIDDDPMVGRAIARLLGGRHEIVVLDSAVRALAELESGKRFDAILCDLMMPAMNGVEFYNRLQTVAPEYVDRVIFMTGGAFTPQASDFLHEPTRHRIDKPFAADKLESAIQRVLH